jgi:hypothetical protein
MQNSQVGEIRFDLAVAQLGANGSYGANAPALRCGINDGLGSTRPVSRNPATDRNRH